jgi:hypothetical protein
VPTDIKGLLILVLFVAPGFIAVLVKNRLVPFSTPSPFRETVESVILSIFHAPVLVLLAPFIARVRPEIAAFVSGTGSVTLADSGRILWIVLLVFLGTAPLTGALYALFLGSNLYPRLFTRVSGALGIFTKTGGAPEIWDALFARNEQWWVAIRFRDGSGYYGLSGEVSVSPSDRQIYLVSAQASTPTPSLYRFGTQGELLEDLMQGPGVQKGVWVRITDQVAGIEISR